MAADLAAVPPAPGLPHWLELLPEAECINAVQRERLRIVEERYPDWDPEAWFVEGIVEDEIPPEGWLLAMLVAHYGWRPGAVGQWKS